MPITSNLSYHKNWDRDFLTGVWIRLRGGPLLSHQYMAEKHKQITAHIILGKTKVERVNILVTHNLA